MDLETQHQDPTSCSAMTTPQDKVEANVPPIIDDEEPSPLLRLPAELWARICKDALYAKGPSRPGNRPRKILWFGFPRNFVRRPQPAITRTCRILRAELLPQFYASRKRFIIYFQPWTDEQNLEENEAMCAWLHVIGSANRRCLKEVALCCKPALLKEELRALRKALRRNGVSSTVERSKTSEVVEYIRNRRKYRPGEFMKYPLVFT
ncbi:hypothetical protein LTR29_016806 [Friedmanniomyces endolithicus]|nr:hypothetical protein LTR29_016806 [Friedmanniomyces endolithicus]